VAGREKVLESDEDSLGEWCEYFERLPLKNPYSMPAYIKFLEWHYGDRAHLFLYEEDDGFVYFPYFTRRLDELDGPGTDAAALRGRCHIHSSWYYGGPLASRPFPDHGSRRGFFEAWVAHARAAGAITELTRFDANLANHELMPQGEWEFDRPTVYVNLEKGAERIWSEFNQSNRWAVKRARRDGASVTFRPADDDASWHRFSEIYHSEMIRKDAPAHLYFGREYFDELRTRLPDNMVLALSSIGEQVCGGLILFVDDVHCSVFLSATDPRFWKSQVNNLGWTEAIWWAKERGLRIFDLMGGRPGVFKYKSHFSPDRARFHVRKAVYDRALYDRLVSARGQSGSAGEQMQQFPAYLRGS